MKFTTTPRALSLFSGAGGFSEGIRLAGFEIVGAVELDRFAAETYRTNFPTTPLYEGDVHDFLTDSGPWSEASHRFPHVVPGAIDLVFGGPPCQGYSQIGTRILDDPRNELYKQFLRIVEHLRPRFVLMENVPNMLLMGKGRFRDEVLDAFREAGYANSTVRLVHANEHGVPQTRTRAVFFGIRDDDSFRFGANEWMEKVLDQERLPEVVVDEAIGDLPARVSKDDSPIPYPRSKRRNWYLDEMRLDRQGTFYSVDDKQRLVGRPLLLHGHHTKEIQERRAHLIRYLEPGMKADSLPKEIWNGRRPEKWRRLHPDWPSHTILAQMHRDLSEWVHPRHHRWISVREAARLQSFHDGFVFMTSEWQMLKQIGNAVPPLLGRALGSVALEALKHGDDITNASSVRMTQT